MVKVFCCLRYSPHPPLLLSPPPFYAEFQRKRIHLLTNYFRIVPKESSHHSLHLRESRSLWSIGMLRGRHRPFPLIFALSEKWKKATPVKNRTPTSFGMLVPRSFKHFLHTVWEMLEIPEGEEDSNIIFRNVKHVGQNCYNMSAWNRMMLKAIVSTTVMTYKIKRIICVEDIKHV